MPGPLPTGNAIRRNKATIPTTSLPASGRQGPAPELPEWVTLGEAGSAWWAWAWATPQACGWGIGVGQEGFVSRRAVLEDDLVDSDDKGRLPIMKEMRELDDRLGLTPKGFAALRWQIVADVEPEAAPAPDSPETERREGRRLRLADAS